MNRLGLLFAWLVAWLGGALAFMPAPAAGESEPFAGFELEFTGRLRARAIADLDGDGLGDIGALLALESAGTQDLRFASCLQTAGGGFAGDCTSIRLPEETRAFDVGEIDGVRGAELVILTDAGIRVTSFVDGSFRELTPLFGVHTIFAGTEPDKPGRLRCLWDVAGDPRLELILPAIEGPKIFRYSSTGPALLQRIGSPAKVTYRLGDPRGEDVTGDIHDHAVRTETRFAAPEVFVEDFDGDGRSDVITLLGRRLRVFLQGTSGGFPASPSVDWDRSILVDDEQEDRISGEGVVFADLNGDGASDIIAMKWGSPSERTRIDRYIYYAREGLAYPEEPDQKVRSESVDRRLMVSDLNGDGKRDLIVPFFHFAASQAVKVVTQNAIRIQFRIFLMGEDGRYSQDAGKDFARVDRRIGLDYEIDVMGFVFGDKSLPADSFNPLISFNADVNGDGYPDLVADTGADRLAFYWGGAQASYASSPDHVIEHESSLDFDLADLNGDRKTDVIRYYAPPNRGAAGRTGERRRGPVIKILLSRP